MKYSSEYPALGTTGREPDNVRSYQEILEQMRAEEEPVRNQLWTIHMSSSPSTHQKALL